MEPIKIVLVDMPRMLREIVSQVVAAQPDMEIVRELEIVRLVDAGLSNKEIAGRLCIEVATVKNHVHNILEKLGVERRAQAAELLRSEHARGRAAGTV